MPAAPAAPQAPEGPLAAFWDKDKGALDTEKLSAAYIERDAAFVQNAERMKGVPEKPEAYKLELPADFKVPQGTKVEFDPKHPVVAKTLEFVHKLGIPQSELSNLLALQTEWQIATRDRFSQEHEQMMAAEDAKLGEGGKARRAAIETYAKAHSFTEDETAEIRLLLSTEAGVRALEKFMAAGNGSSIPGHPEHRPPPAAPTRIEDRLYPNLNARKAS